MKFILIFSTIFFCSKFSFAQKKGDNTIIVHGFVGNNKIKEALFEEGFVMANSDTFFISTNSKAMGFIGDVSYIIKKTDTTLTFKGFVEATINGYSTGKDPLENKGERGTAYRIGFATMNKIAASFGLSLTYLKNK